MNPLPPWHSRASDRHRRNALADPVFRDRRADAAEQPLGLALTFPVERRHEAEDEPCGGFGFEREVGDDVRHDRLVDELALEGPSVCDVVSGLRHRLAHQPGGADREVEPGVMVHR